MASTAGTLVGAPVFLALYSLRAEPPPVLRWVPTLIAGASTSIVVIVSIWGSSVTGRNFSYLVIVPVMVSAVWLGQRHTALLVGGLAVSLAAATSRGRSSTSASVRVLSDDRNVSRSARLIFCSGIPLP